MLGFSLDEDDASPIGGRWLPDKNTPVWYVNLFLSAVPDIFFVRCVSLRINLPTHLIYYIEASHHAPHLQIALVTTPGNYHLEHRRYLPSALIATCPRLGHLGHPHRRHYLPICLSYISVLGFSGPCISVLGFSGPVYQYLASLCLSCISALPLLRLLRCDRTTSDRATERRDRDCDRDRDRDRDRRPELEPTII